MSGTVTASPTTLDARPLPKIFFPSAIEGNTSMAADPRQRQRPGQAQRRGADILGWVDMHPVLARMIDNGKWVGEFFADAPPSPGRTSAAARRRHHR